MSVNYNNIYEDKKLILIAMRNNFKLKLVNPTIYVLVNYQLKMHLCRPVTIYFNRFNFFLT